MNKSYLDCLSLVLQVIIAATPYIVLLVQCSNRRKENIPKLSIVSGKWCIYCLEFKGIILCIKNISKYDAYEFDVNGDLVPFKLRNETSIETDVPINKDILMPGDRVEYLMHVSKDPKELEISFKNGYNKQYVQKYLISVINIDEMDDKCISIKALRN